MTRSENIAKEKRLAWWWEAKFGLFVHWGIYAVPGGVWQGKEIEGIGEWIAYYANIPHQVYSLFANEFNPQGFNPDDWAQLILDAGMKYIVFTAKHCDGFSMFKSEHSDFNVVDGTPYSKDIVKQLVDACRAKGIRIGFYYSQDNDLHEPDAGAYSLLKTNVNSSLADSPEGFVRFVHRKVLPQLTELLTNYGPIDLIWFDNPVNMTEALADEIEQHVRAISPHTIINGRIGLGRGDYVCMGDNQVPAKRVDGYWETIGTINDTWGYKSHDHNWKSTKALINNLVNIVSKGGTYLLNAGPTADGIIPEPSADRLRDMGKWLRANGNGASIYGASPTPYDYDFDWGLITTKKTTMYLHIFEWPKTEFGIKGIKNRVKNVYFLSDPAKKVCYTKASDGGELTIELPKKQPDQWAAVIAVELEGGKIEIDNKLQLQPCSGLIMPGCAAVMHPAEAWGTMRLNKNGILTDWYSQDNYATWNVTIDRPGEYDCYFINKAVSLAGWLGGHKAVLSIGGQRIIKTLSASARQRFGSTDYPFFSNRIGSVTLEAGEYTLVASASFVNPKARGGLNIYAVKLVPAKKGRKKTANQLYDENTEKHIFQ